MVRYEIMKVGVDKDFIQYTSPSVILGQLSRGDFLLYWATGEAIKYIKERCYDDCGDGYVSVSEKTLEKSKNAWKNKRDKTADIGTELHDLVEAYINMKLHKADQKQFDKFKEKLQNRKNNVRDMFYQFLVWSKDNVKKYIESEQHVVHKSLCYAGKLDFGYLGKDSKTYCVDLKTSNAIYSNHEIQVVSYKYARETMDGEYVIKSSFGKLYDKTLKLNKIKYDKCAILNISRDYFYLDFKVVKDEHYKQESFKALLLYYYVSAKRKINNIRAKERR